MFRGDDGIFQLQPSFINLTVRDSPCKGRETALHLNPYGQVVS